MIERELQKYLISTTYSTGVTGLISNRMYIETLPTSVTYPCVSMFRISHNEHPRHELPRVRIQFSCFGNYYSSAFSIAEAIRTELKRFYGQPETSTTIYISQSLVDNITYMYDDSLDKHIAILDMIFRYKE